MSTSYQKMSTPIYENKYIPCPKCQKQRVSSICDNSCGTMTCTCGTEYYLNNECVLGHSPT